MVYVLDMNSKPLMPTERHGKIRRLLKEHKAIVIKKCPFTIKLLYESGSEIQDINLGIDAGSKVIGLSATTATKVLFEAEVELRNDIVNLLASRREYRRSRRHRKTRYRACRFDNRNKPQGWLAPSVVQKIQTHLYVVAMIHKLLPISNVYVEVASFDIQRIQNPEIQGVEYQQGKQLGFWNVREYVLWRDEHTCQSCKGKTKDPRLNVHHIESRKTGGDSPDNLITLCETCHHDFHKGLLKLKFKRGPSFRDAAFMNIMRWTFFNALQTRYPRVFLTYGYITKSIRIENGLAKEHYIDARCISGNPKAFGSVVYLIKKLRCHNRRIHKAKILKGGKRKLNQAPYIVKGFRLWDRVKYMGKFYVVKSRRQVGAFELRSMDGDNRVVSAKPTDLTFVDHNKNYLIKGVIDGNNRFRK